ncbi:MAG: aminodeoxychorismate/anthranilate synthase component II [Bacteroidota bacterium]
MKILLIDNYDSFTWNLRQLLLEAGAEGVEVVKNDAVNDTQVHKADALVFSPGPGLPHEAGRMKELINSFAGSKKILGICLGHQAIAEVFGARLIHADEICHGTSTKLDIKEKYGIFSDLPGDVLVGRYHSWVVDDKCIPEALRVTAYDEKGVIMALRHVELDVTGLQFHPESILTPLGEKMIRNWMGVTKV